MKADATIVPLERLHSKRNHVTKAQLTFADGRSEYAVIKDFGDHAEGFEKELRIVRKLQQHGIPVAKIQSVENHTIVYEYIEGSLGVDLLDDLEQDPENPAIYQQFYQICLWIQAFYQAMEQEFPKGLILHDIHLRNFICGQRVYGVDFESCCEGSRESDIARLCAFTATYTPSYSPAKLRLASFLAKTCTEIMQLDTAVLKSEMHAQLKAICLRRGLEARTSIMDEIMTFA